MTPAFENIVSKTVPSPQSPLIITFTDNPAEQPGAHDDSDYLTQDGEVNENLTSEEHDQSAAEQQTDDLGSAAYAADHFDEGESSNDAEPEQTQPADDEESTVGPLSGDERTEQPVGVEDNHEQAIADLDRGYPRPAEDFDAATLHVPSDDRDAQSFGEILTERKKVTAANEDYESDYNEVDQGSEPGESVAIEGDARDADWEKSASDAQGTQDYLEQHKDQDDAEEVHEREQVARTIVAGDLMFLFTDSGTIDLTAQNPDDDHITRQQGKWLPSVHQYYLTLRQRLILTHLDDERWTNLQMLRKKLEMISTPTKGKSQIVLQASLGPLLDSCWH